MTNTDVTVMAQKLFDYRALETRRDDVARAMEQIGLQSAFNGKAPGVEVDSLRVWFTPSGGEASFDVLLHGLHVPSATVGGFLKSVLQARLDELNQEMEKL